MTDAAPPFDGSERPLAGEYVLGVLDADERAEAARRAASEPGFARDVAFWEAALTPLAAAVAPVSPPPGLWPRIANLISETGRPGVWNSAPFWRGLSAGALTLAAASLVVLVWPRTPPPSPATPIPAPTRPPPAEVAMIKDPVSQRPALVATLDRAGGELILTPVAMEMPQGRDAELWIIPEGQKAVSLGVIPVDAPQRMPMPEGLTGGGVYTATLAVTDEPRGGSPTGQATGAIRAAGKFVGA